MGQYHYVVNLDRREYLHPHKFDDGLKLLEFGCSGDGTMTGLAVLLASACKGGARGGGDIRSTSRLVGSWAGDRIAIVGDYGERDDVPGVKPDGENLYDDIAQSRDGRRPDRWTDISGDVIAMLREAGEWRRPADPGLPVARPDIVT